jgi:hypothetical protein
MAIDDFANCYATRVETTVDAIIDDVRRLGEDNIRRLVDWWANANDSSKDLVKLLAGAATAVLAVILGKLLTSEGATIIVAFLGGASWTLLVMAFTECVGQL